MDGKLNIFSVIAKRMDWLGQRQQVLADNIANSDTPNYVPRDLSETRFKRHLAERLGTVEPTATHARHMQASVARDGAAESQRQGHPYEASPSGNQVVIEEQLIKVAKTQSDYQLMTSLYRKHMAMFRMALRGGGG